MWRIRRFHVDQIGVRDNRFVDVTVDLTGTDGDPADSIVWLRNGAGKTTMLSLLIAHILPNRHDFLARKTGKKRTLEDLVASGDTSHVACEWVDPAGNILLTGAVYEWSGRSRPRDYNSADGRKSFARRFWIVREDPAIDGATFDTLPFSTRTAARVDLAGFAEHIRSLSRSGVDAVVEADSVTQWHEALVQRRFDPELFRYFATVNGTEGGLEHLFDKIDSPASFARFLLGFVTDPARATGVRDLLGDTAAEIAKRPAYEADRDFSRHVAPLLDNLADAHAKVAATKTALEEAEANAATWRRDLLDGADAALRRAELAEARAAQEQQRYLQAINDRRRQRNMAAEYRWIGARHRSSSAAEHAKGAKIAEDEAAAAVAALDALVVLVEREQRQAALDARLLDRSAALEAASPFEDALTAAQADLAATIGQRISDAVTQVGADTTERDDAKELHGTLGGQRDDVIKARSGLDTEKTLLSESVARFERDRSTAITAGHLDDGEAPADAQARHDATVADLGAQIDELVDSTDELRENLEGLEGEHQAALGRAAGSRSHANNLAAEHELRVATATELAGQPRLVEIAQSNDIDLDRDGTILLEGLDAAVARGDVAIVDARVDGAEDARAIDSLERTQLLPARRDVTTIVTVLQRLGHRAEPGWRYLAERVPVAEHHDVIAAHPGIVDGVVVYDDADVVARALAEDGGEVADVVVIARASTLGQPGTRHVIVGPARARHDVDAGSVELEERRARAATAADGLAAITARRDADRNLRERLASFLAVLGDGGLAGSEAAAAEADSTATTDEEAAATAAQAVTDARAEIDGIGTRIGELRANQAQATVAANVTAHLAAEDVERYQPGIARLDAIADEDTVLAEALSNLDRERNELTERIGQLNTAIDGRTRDIREWRAELAVLPDPAGRAPSTDTIDVLRTRVEEAQSTLDEVLDDPDLANAITRCQRDLAKSEQRLSQFAAEAVAAARVLTDRPEAADVYQRDRTRKAVADEHRARTKQAAVAASEAERAEREAQALAPTRGAHHADIDDEPGDAEAADAAAEAAEEAASEQQNAETAAERERDDAAEQARAAKSRAGLLGDQAERLRTVAPAEHGAGRTLPDDDSELRAAVGAVVADVDDADGKYRSAQTVRSQRIEALRSFAGQDRFVHLSETEHGRAIHQVRSMILGDDLTERVAPIAGDLALDLIERANKIDDQLARIAQHKRNVVARLGELVHVGLSDLARVSRLSELPEGIGPWAGKQFVRVGERGGRPDQGQIDVRVGELVDDMVRAGKVEIEPVELLWLATEAAVGNAGFHASILKPTPEQDGTHVPVADMNKWSGGETLTASLLIFCVMARLRSENRNGGGRSRVHAGVVPLDNPVGKANYREFLNLQRKVAAANGAQLLFWTGIGDLGAVTTFPRIVAMRKASSAAVRGAAFVGEDTSRSQRVIDDLEQMRVEVSASVRVEQTVLL